MAIAPSADAGFGEWLGWARGRAGLSVDALAERSATTVTYLSSLADGRGRPSEEVVRRLADALGLALGSVEHRLFCAAGRRRS